MKSFKLLLVSLIKAPSITWAFIVPTAMSPGLLSVGKPLIALRLADDNDDDIGEPTSSETSKTKEAVATVTSSVFDNAGLSSVPLFLAPVAALAAGRESLLRRDKIKEEVATTEEELVKIKELLKQLDRLIYGTFGVAAVSSVLLLSSLLGGPSFPKATNSLASSSLAQDASTVVISKPMLAIPELSVPSPLNELKVEERESSKLKGQAKAETDAAELVEAAPIEAENKLSEAGKETAAKAEAKFSQDIKDTQQKKVALSAAEGSADSDASKASTDTASEGSIPVVPTEEKTSQRPFQGLMTTLENAFSGEKESTSSTSTDAETSTIESTKDEEEVTGSEPTSATEEKESEPAFDNLKKKFENAFSAYTGSSSSTSIDTEISPSEAAKIVEEEATETVPVAPTLEKTSEPLDNLVKKPENTLSAEKETNAAADTSTGDNNEGATGIAPVAPIEEKKSESSLDNLMKKLEHALTADKESASGVAETSTTENSMIAEEATEIDPVSPTGEKTSKQSFDNLMKKLGNALSNDKESTSTDAETTTSENTKRIEDEATAAPTTATLPPAIDDVKAADGAETKVAPSATVNKEANKLSPLQQSRGELPTKVELPDFSSLTKDIDPQVAQAAAFAAVSLAVGAGLIAFSQSASQSDSRTPTASGSYLNSLFRDTAPPEGKPSSGSSYLDKLSRSSGTLPSAKGGRPPSSSSYLDNIPKSKSKPTGSSSLGSSYLDALAQKMVNSVTTTPASSSPVVTADIPTSQVPTSPDGLKRVVKFSQFGEQPVASPPSAPSSQKNMTDAAPGRSYDGAWSGSPTATPTRPPQTESTRTDTAPGRSYIDKLSGSMTPFAADTSYAPQGKKWSGSSGSSYLDLIAQPTSSPSVQPTIPSPSSSGWDNSNTSLAGSRPPIDAGQRPETPMGTSGSYLDQIAKTPSPSVPYSSDVGSSLPSSPPVDKRWESNGSITNSARLNGGWGLSSSSISAGGTVPSREAPNGSWLNGGRLPESAAPGGPISPREGGGMPPPPPPQSFSSSYSTSNDQLSRKVQASVAPGPYLESLSGR